MSWELDQPPAIVVLVLTAVLATGAMYALMNANMIYSAWRLRHKPRVHGPWCVIATRPPFGIEIIYQANGRSNVTRWRNRNRNEYPYALRILTRDEVDKKNSETMASSEYWAVAWALAPYVDEAVQGAAASPFNFTTPSTSILTMPALTQARTLEHIERLIEESQLLSDGIRTLKRKVQIPNE